MVLRNLTRHYSYFNRIPYNGLVAGPQHRRAFTELTNSERHQSPVACLKCYKKIAIGAVMLTLMGSTDKAGARQLLKRGWNVLIKRF